MLEHMKMLAQYQIWANDHYRKNLEQLDFSKATIQTPYGSLLDLIVHIFGAVELWMKRIEGFSPKSIRTGENYKDWKTVMSDWEEIDKNLLDYIEKVSEKDLTKIIAYTSIEGKNHKLSIDHILLQAIAQHQSYHRGQIAVILRENGLPPVRATDYVYYKLEQQK